MGCNCGQTRRAHGGITSNVPNQPITPQEAAANAIANSRAEAYSAEESTPSAGSSEQE